MNNSATGLSSYLPSVVNNGPWLPAYTLFQLRELPSTVRFVLPICSVDVHYSELVSGTESDALLLPPLFREAMTGDLQYDIVNRIFECFPVYGDRGANSERLEVVEYDTGGDSGGETSGLLAFSVDTAVEEHGPHLPLGTDTIQSYNVLRKLAESVSELQIEKPLEYGQLTWGLPFGFSIDITSELLTQYVAGYVNALVKLRTPQAIYVVDVHGAITHRQAIIDGLKQSRCANWAFRWLHEPLAEFASARGDQHAGGVETALVNFAGRDLVDQSWFPDRETEIVSGQMTLEQAVELSPDLAEFGNFVRKSKANGIVGDVRNYHTLDQQLMFDRMLQIASSDVQSLLRGDDKNIQNAGENLW